MAGTLCCTPQIKSKVVIKPGLWQQQPSFIEGVSSLAWPMARSVFLAPLCLAIAFGPGCGDQMLPDPNATSPNLADVGVDATLADLSEDTVSLRSQCSQDNDCPEPLYSCLLRRCLVGVCVFAPAVDGAARDDGEPCTESDLCLGGACQSGANMCGCELSADCADREDGDVCNGKLYGVRIRLDVPIVSQLRPALGWC